MASGNDVREILELPRSATSTPKPRSNRPEKEKKPDGISRELYQLIGGAPPVALIKPTYKAKPNLKKRAVSWTWRGFINPSRTDNLVLYHWVKASEDEKEEYRFAKFNHTTEIIEYTDDDYVKHLADIDWTKEETDYLFALCRTYDLRFPVITDRYDFPGKSRTMEDLKDRYYDVNRKLLKARLATSESGHLDNHVKIKAMAYDKAREVERKKNLEQLFRRTPEQIEEEEALFIEAVRIEQNEKKLAKERENVMRFLHTLEPLPSPASGNLIATPTNITSMQSTTTPTADKHKKKKHKADATPASESPTASFGESSKKSKSLSVSENKESLSAAEVAAGVVRSREKLVPGVYVRSQKMQQIRQSALAKVTKVMEELNIGPRPIMPTQSVCAKFEQLHSTIVTLLDMKRQLDRLEQEVKTQRLRKSGVGLNTPIDGEKEKKEGATGQKRPANTTPSGTPRNIKRGRK
ncbi:uncharacterized protein VTP21DRAFT_6750 [Calcarisporiella thermophila]|uniref:uncharacterized protein n=1 Tax=Calcarisporiella thermophila TaxID=911321 RepID=UPI003743DC85